MQKDNKVVLKALRWSFLGELLNRTITPVVFLVMARLLSPEDYGVAASSLLIIGFCQVFSDGGLARTYIQYRGDQNKAADAILIMNVSFSLALCLLLVVVFQTPVVSGFDQRVVAVVSMQSIQLLIAAVGGVHGAILQKNFDFKSLFIINFGTTVASSIISVGCALSGFGYWALVFGPIFGELVRTGLLLRNSAWRPLYKIDWGVSKDLLSFGKWQLMSSLLVWFYLWVDTAYVAYFLGVREMGLYRTGGLFVGTVFGMLFSPILPVLYSTYSSMKGDVGKVRERVVDVTVYVTVVSLLLAILLYLYRDFITTLVFGPDWDGIESVVGMLALATGVSWLVGPLSDAFRAIGRPSLDVIPKVIMIPFVLAAYWLAGGYGLVVLLYVKLAICIFAIPIYVVVANKSLGVGLDYLLVGIKKALLPLVMVVAFWWLTDKRSFFGGGVLAGFLVYAVGVWLVDRRIVIDLLVLLRLRRES